MTRYQIKEEGSAVSIELTEVGGRTDELLSALAECKAGRCSCPTDECRKLAAMTVQQDYDAVQVRLEPKPAESFDLSEIQACLDHTTADNTEEQATKQV